MHADLVFLNGTIVTVDDRFPAATGVATLNGRIGLVGSESDVRDTIGPETRVVDLAGRALLPGFNDNHNHPISFGEALSAIDASPGSAPTLV